MRHLVRVAARGTETGMTPRNVAIVWAPNLLRCKELEVGGVAALQGVGVQAVVTEFLVCYAELIFGDGPVGRPKSLAITTSARLLTLEEARNRSLRGEPDYIEVGAGPAGLPLRYHTVIELPRKRNGSKRSPSLNWRAIFGRSTMGKARQIGTPPQVETVPNSLNSLRRLRSVKSADSLDGEDSLGPLLGGPPPTRTCGHSRSVSHDSYFDHLADAPNASSPLDLSEIQLNFDLEEREMRMLSEEEGGGAASIEASPRRQRTETNQCPGSTNGGSKRKRSRLEERLQCDVELRFIDSQSPDQVIIVNQSKLLYVIIFALLYLTCNIFQVMIATNADIHSIDTPSPLPTPDYLPLLSEASTPLTPAVLHGASHSPSSMSANSSRISFRSFTLPLEVGDEHDRNNSASKKETNVSSSEKSSDPNDRLPMNLISRDKELESCEKIKTYRTELRDKNAITSLAETVKSPSATHSDVIASFFNTEITSCNRLSLCGEIGCNKITTSHKDTMNRLNSQSLKISESYDRKEDSYDIKGRCDKSSDSLSNVTIAADLPKLSSCNTTDLDSPMSCEQTLQELQESGFIVCDSSNVKLFNNAENQCASNNTNDASEWVIIEETTGSITTPISESTSPNDSFLKSGANPVASENISETSLECTLMSNVDTFCIGIDNSTKKSILAQENEEMIFDFTGTKEYTIRKKIPPQTNFNLTNEDNLVNDDSRSCLHDRENGNRYSCNTTDLNLSEESNATEQRQTRACYIEMNNANIFVPNQNETCKEQEMFRETETFENYHHLSRDNISTRHQGASHALQITNHPRFSDKFVENQETINVTMKQDSCDNDHSNGLSKKCQNYTFGSNSQKQQINTQQRKCTFKCDENQKCINLQANQVRGNIDVRIPSENAAEPCEVAHAPEGASEMIERTLDMTSDIFTNVPVQSSTSVDDAVVLRDTAAILQELALQRLSGGAVGDAAASVRRKYENEAIRDRKNLDSEIGREIIKERKLRQELDSVRGKNDEISQHLPPCLRARHARATRAALSRSLDEAKFNRMTGEMPLSVKQASDDAQHCSTPNVGGNNSTYSSASEKIQLKNLGGLDLGDPQCRERIEKYKEERRTFLRDKYRSESFRGISSKTEDDDEQALLIRLKQRASRPSLH